MTFNESEWYKNRFEPARYQLVGSGTSGPSQFVPQIKGLYAFPRGDDWVDEDEMSSSSSED